MASDNRKFPDLVSPEVLAKEVFKSRISTKTLAMRRWKGEPPPYFKICGRVFYDRDEVKQWIETCKIDPNRKPKKKGIS